MPITKDLQCELGRPRNWHILVLTQSKSDRLQRSFALFTFDLSTSKMYKTRLFDMALNKSSASAEVADRNVTWYVL